MEMMIQTCGSGRVCSDILMRAENVKAEKLGDEVAKHFWPMIGTANQVAFQTIDEAVDMMRETGMLRQREKVMALKALDAYERYQKRA